MQQLPLEKLMSLGETINTPSLLSLKVRYVYCFHISLSQLLVAKDMYTGNSLTSYFFKIFSLAIKLPNWLFPLGFLTKNVYVFLFSRMPILAPAHPSLFDLIVPTIFGDANNLKPLIIQISPAFCHFWSLRSKCYPQRHILISLYTYVIILIPEIKFEYNYQNYKLSCNFLHSNHCVLR